MKVIKYTLIIVRSNFCNDGPIELLYLVLMTSEKSAKRIDGRITPFFEMVCLGRGGGPRGPLKNTLFPSFLNNFVSAFPSGQGNHIPNSD